MLFDDVVLMIQVKAQCGRHDPMSWATEKLLEAFKQLRKTHESLVTGAIKKLRNDLYGEIEFDPKSYPNSIGLIILAHSSAPYIAAKLAPEILTGGFPIHVFSLGDFATVCSRFDTAGDLITFLELRGDVAAKELLYVQDEIGNIERMIPHTEEVLRARMSPTSPEVMQKTVRAFGEIASGKLLLSPDWRYGLGIDDMIARVHDFDPELAWNKGKDKGQVSMEVARFLGWLTRERRIKLGKKIISACEAAKDGKLHYFPRRAAFTWNGVRLPSYFGKPLRSSKNSRFLGVLRSYEIRQEIRRPTVPRGCDRTYWQWPIVRLHRDANGTAGSAVGATQNLRRSILVRPASLSMVLLK